MSVNKREKFKQLLKTMFQYQQDKLSLDFGVYRVFRHKALEIEHFLETALPTLTDNTAQQHGIQPEDTYNDVLEFFGRYYQDGDFYPLPQYGGRGSHWLRHNGEETLFTWANRDQYYIKSLADFAEYRVCDVLPSGGLIANQSNVLVFTIGNVEEVQGDQKKARYFVLDEAATTWDETGLQIRFNYLANKAAGVTAEILQRHLAERGVGELPLDSLAHHLNRFQNLRKSDFFIHKDLGRFLHEQLQFYVKAEVIKLEDPYSLKRAMAVLAVGKVVIDFLHKLENLQKKLWEKKKFAYNVGYIITLDKLAQYAPAWLETHLETLVQTMRAEWQSLGLGNFADVQSVRRVPTAQGDLLATASTAGYLPLPVDTRRFQGNALRLSMLAAIAETGSIEARLDGWAVHSDNWQALNTLSNRFRDKVKCIYIDPPYNTSASSIPYRNGYPHSSWGTLMHNRLQALRELMSRDGAIFVSIDKVERNMLEHVMDDVFGAGNRVEELIWIQNTNDGKSPTYSTNHEYVEVYAKHRLSVEADRSMFREPKPGYAEVMELVDRLNPDYPSVREIETKLKTLYETHKQELREECEQQDMNWEEEKRNDPWKGLYPYSNAEYRDINGKYVTESEARERQAQIWIWRESDWTIMSSETKQSDTIRDPNHPNHRYYEPIHPKTGKPCRMSTRGWKGTQFIDPTHPERNSFESLVKDHRMAFGDDENKVPQQKRFIHEVETNVSKSVFTDYSDGEKQTSAMFGKTGLFLAPKHTNFVSRFIIQGSNPDSIVVDCFGGSGSTAHAVMETNKIEKSRRQFITVETNAYFDTLIIPRLKKVAVANKWQVGNPKDLDGAGVFMKVLKLEQYEETLENCVLQSNQAMDVEARMQAVAQLAALPELYREQYLNTLVHFAERESPALLADIPNDWLANPFSFSLQIQQADGTFVHHPVDLPETFSLWLGQTVDSIKTFDYQGSKRLLVQGSGITCYWRDLPELAAMTEDYVTGDMALLAQHSDTHGKLYINGINHHPKMWLPANAQETLYALRSLMLDEVGA